MKKIYGEEKMIEGLLLVDIEISNEKKKILEEFLKPYGFTIAEAKNLTPWIIPLIYQEKENSLSLIILPGKGAQIIWWYLQNLQMEHEWVIPVFAKRGYFDERGYELGQSPVVIVSSVSLPATFYPEIKKVIVVDDVISSGQTMTLLYERNVCRFPRAEWVAFTWIMQRTAKIKNFVRIYATLVVKKEHGQRVPINSLSTLISNSEIAKSYAKRRFHSCAKTFLSLLASLP